MAPVHLLIVDDSLPDIHLVTAAFEDYPDVRLTAHDQAAVALNWLEARAVTGDLPDLVLLDLHMPGMDGLEWLSVVQQRPGLQDLPILLYSLTPMDRQLQQVAHTSVFGCWQKPLTFQGMQVHAETLWTIWQQDGHFHPAALQQPAGL